MRAERGEGEGRQRSGRRDEMRLESAEKEKGRGEEVRVVGERQSDGWRHRQGRV